MFSKNNIYQKVKKKEFEVFFRVHFRENCEKLSIKAT